MKNFTFVSSLLLVSLSGCATPNGIGLGSTVGGGQPSAGGDLQTIVQSLGTPVPFDQVFTEVQGVPRFKGEFETAAQFEQRQTEARAKCQERYLISTPVDMDKVRYDADKQLLTVTVWALKNTGSTDDELGALFGWSSDLHNANVKIEYGTSISSNVEWAFPRDRRKVGTYDSQNAFGVHATVVKEEATAWGIFERQGAWGGLLGGDMFDGEDVWFRRQPRNVEVSMRAAFEIKADPDRARALKQGGAMRAGVLVAPRYPFYATGTVHGTPTIQDPLDRTTTVRYLVGDIQAVVLYDASGQFVAVRETR